MAPFLSCSRFDPKQNFLEMTFFIFVLSSFFCTLVCFEVCFKFVHWEKLFSKFQKISNFCSSGVCSWCRQTNAVVAAFHKLEVDGFVQLLRFHYQRQLQCINIIRPTGRHLVRTKVFTWSPLSYISTLLKLSPFCIWWIFSFVCKKQWKSS